MRRDLIRMAILVALTIGCRDAAAGSSAGHAAENALLEATALGLATVPVAAFDDDALRGVLEVGAAETLCT